LADQKTKKNHVTISTDIEKTFDRIRNKSLISQKQTNKQNKQFKNLAMKKTSPTWYRYL
jgi:hypothetical protein